MKLRTKKRLLNIASLALVAVAAVVLWQAWHAAPPTVAVDSPPIASGSLTATTIVQAPSIDANAASWQRTLRRPLYDPPPVAPPPVVVQPRPITVKLIGTVIEPDNNQAFVRQASGSVELKRLGDKVTADPADGVIAAITANAIVIRRDDGEHHVPVEGRN